MQQCEQSIMEYNKECFISFSHHKFSTALTILQPLLTGSQKSGLSRPTLLRQMTTLWIHDLNLYWGTNMDYVHQWRLRAEEIGSHL
jgi:hypothetical protein